MIKVIMTKDFGTDFIIEGDAAEVLAEFMIIAGNLILEGANPKDLKRLIDKASKPEMLATLKSAGPIKIHETD